MSVDTTDEYVCPDCGRAARGASVCEGCGANLDAYHPLPLRSEFEAGLASKVVAQPERGVALYGVLILLPASVGAAAGIRVGARLDGQGSAAAR